jgi:hypothetical protein
VIKSLGDGGTHVGKSQLDLLKDFSALLVAVAATLYLFGYLVHLAYFRLLGVEIIGQPLDYMRLAADYSTSVVSSSLQLPVRLGYYWPKLIEGPAVLVTISCGLMVLLLLTLYLPVQKLRTSLNRRPRISNVLREALNIVILASLALTINRELNIVKVRDVLQPVDPTDIQQMQGQPDHRSVLNWQNEDSLRLANNNVRRVYQRYTQTQRDAPGFGDWNNWFNPTARLHPSEERSATYLALLFVSIIAITAAVFHLYASRKAISAGVRTTEGVDGKSAGTLLRVISAILKILIIFQLLLFPFVYATLGRYFTYPVVSLKINLEVPKSKTGEKEQLLNDSKTQTTKHEEQVGLLDPAWTHCVYLIAQTDGELVVYDRLNFFQIKHVPRSRVLAVNQLFNASPFDSCAKAEDEFLSCEVLCMPEAKPVSDF